MQKMLGCLVQFLLSTKTLRRNLIELIFITEVIWITILEGHDQVNIAQRSLTKMINKKSWIAFHLCH